MWLLTRQEGTNDAVIPWSKLRFCNDLNKFVAKDIWIYVLSFQEKYSQKSANIWVIVLEMIPGCIIFTEVTGFRKKVHFPNFATVSLDHPRCWQRRQWRGGNIWEMEGIPTKPASLAAAICAHSLTTTSEFCTEIFELIFCVELNFVYF